MTWPRMHEDEVHTDEHLVRRLLGGQFPRLADLPIARVPSSGTDNALYRLGDDMVVRLPRIQWAVGAVAKDAEWLDRLRPLVPVGIPELVERGDPAEGYEWEWGVYRWLSGQNPPAGAVSGSELARFVAALWEIDLPDPPEAFRGHALNDRDEQTTRTRIPASPRMRSTGSSRCSPARR